MACIRCGAGERIGTGTDTGHAGVGLGAGIVVIAGIGVIVMHAAGGWVAGIIGAVVAIVAIGSCSADAGSSGTGVIRGAGITVVTGIGVVHMRAAGGRVAGIIGAGVAVVAVRRRASIAGPTTAGVTRRTGVAVGAGICVVLVRTAGGRVAGIIGAGVSVIAVEGTGSYTDP
jgi:hypothetical protein